MLTYEHAVTCAESPTRWVNPPNRNLSWTSGKDDGILNEVTMSLEHLNVHMNHEIKPSLITTGMRNRTCGTKRRSAPHVRRRSDILERFQKAFQPEFGVYRGLALVLRSSSNPPNSRKKKEIMEKRMFIFCTKLWYAPKTLVQKISEGCTSPPSLFGRREKTPTPKTKFSIWTLLRTPGRFTTRPLPVQFTTKCP